MKRPRFIPEVKAAPQVRGNLPLPRGVSPTFDSSPTPESVAVTRGGQTRSRKVAFPQARNKQNRPYRDYWSVERAVDLGLVRSVWVWRACMAIATNQAKLPFVVRKGNWADGDIIDGHPVAEFLNGNVTGFDHIDTGIFRRMMSMQLLLNRQGSMVEFTKSRMGDPKWLRLLPPGATWPIPHPQKFIEGFWIQYPGDEIRTVKAENVIWVREPHPVDWYSGLTPMEAAGLSVEVDWYSRLWNRNFILNDARPAAVIAVKGMIDDEDADALVDRLSGGGGPNSAGRMAVLETETGADILDLSTNPRDAQYVEMRKAVKDEILMAFGVPESVAGNASGRTFDNADAELEVYWRETMLPHLELIARAFDVLTPDPGEFVSFDFARVPILEHDHREQVKQALAEMTAGTRSRNEFRKVAGLDKVKGGQADLLYVPTGYTEVADVIDSEYVKPDPMAAMMGGQQDPNALDPNAEDTGGNWWDQTTGDETQADQFGGFADSLAGKAWEALSPEEKSRIGNLLKRGARDGDGDGLVDDGTPFERPVPMVPNEYLDVLDAIDQGIGGSIDLNHIASNATGVHPLKDPSVGKRVRHYLDELRKRGMVAYHEATAHRSERWSLTDKGRNVVAGHVRKPLLGAMPADGQRRPITGVWPADTLAWGGKSLQGDRNGIMVALCPPEAIAGLVAVPGYFDPTEMHVTLCYLGDTNDTDIDFTTLASVVGSWARNTLAFDVTVGGPGEFETDNGQCCYSTITAPALQKNRATLVFALNGADISVPDKYGEYKPHMTRAYNPSEPLPEHPMMTWTATEVMVAYGTQRVFFPLMSKVISDVNEGGGAKEMPSAVKEDWVAQHETWEDTVAGAVENHFDRQERVIIEKLTSRKVRSAYEKAQDGDS